MTACFLRLVAVFFNTCRRPFSFFAAISSPASVWLSGALLQPASFICPFNSRNDCIASMAWAIFLMGRVGVHASCPEALYLGSAGLFLRQVVPNASLDI